MLDRDGSRTPIEFHISNDRDLNPIDAQVVQAATKWKRMALAQFGCRPGEGICTDMKAVRKDSPFGSTRRISPASGPEEGRRR